MLSAESTTKAWQLRDRVSDREKVFYRLYLRPAGDGKSGKGVPNPRVVASDLSSQGEQPNAHGLLGGLSTHGTGRFERAIEASQKAIADDPDVVFGYSSLASSYFFLDRFEEAESALQRASERKLEAPIFLVLRYNIAVLEGRPGPDGPGSGSGQGQAQGGTLDGSRGGSRSGSFRPLTGRPGGHRAAPWIWPCKRGNARRQRVTRPHERCGKPFAGMLPKRKGTPWRRSRFRTAGMSNTPPALPWLFRETPLDRNRLPMIWKSASRKIRSPNLLTYRFFARYRHWSAGKPTDSVERLQIALSAMSWR